MTQSDAPAVAITSPVVASHQLYRRRVTIITLYGGCRRLLLLFVIYFYDQSISKNTVYKITTYADVLLRVGWLDLKDGGHCGAVGSKKYYYIHLYSHSSVDTKQTKSKQINEAKRQHQMHTQQSIKHNLSTSKTTKEICIDSITQLTHSLDASSKLHKNIM